MSESGVVAQGEVEAAVAQAVAKALDMKPENVALGASLQEEYGAESLDILDIVFSLEKRFRIRLPKNNLVQLAQQRFGEGSFVNQGEFTELGLRVLREMRPEIDPALFRPGLRLHDVSRLVTAQTFVRLVMRLLEGKRQARLTMERDGCAKCGSKKIDDSSTAPEFVCAACGATFPVPSGDSLLMRDLEDLRLDDAK